MADDREFHDIEAELEAYFAKQCDGDDDDDNDDNAFMFGESDCSKAFARLLCSSDWGAPLSLQPPMFPFSNCGTKQSMNEDCVKIYDEEKVKIYKILKSLDGQINLSAEMLRDFSCIEYICLKAHFIDEYWKLNNWVLLYHALPDIVFVTGIQQALVAWGLEDKISTITLKNTNYIEYIDEIVQTVKDQVQKKKMLQLGGRLFHVYCCAELLSQMVQEAFKVISDIIDKVTTLISRGRSECWHITHSRLKGALELHCIGEFSSVEPGGIHEVPSAEEWKKVEGICRLVDIMHNVAKLLFESKNRTACIFLGNLETLKASLTLEASRSNEFIKAVVEKMLKEFDKYWEKMFLVLAIATVLDPRCKMHYIDFTCSKIEGTDGKAQASTVLEAIHCLYNDYCPVSILKNDAAPSATKDIMNLHIEEESFLKKARRDEKAPEQHGEVGHLNDGSTGSSSLKTDLDRYLEEPVLSWRQDFNLLNWWRDASSQYPTLSRMARDLLSIQFSVLTSFDGYYTEERPIDPYVASKGQKFTNALMCTRSWSSKC